MGTDEPPGIQAFNFLPFAIPPQYSSEYNKLLYGDGHVYFINAGLIDITAGADKFCSGRFSDADFRIRFATHVDDRYDCCKRFNIIYNCW